MNKQPSTRHLEDARIYWLFSMPNDLVKLIRSNPHWLFLEFHLASNSS